MFWLMRNKFCGSNLALMAASRFALPVGSPNAILVVLRYEVHVGAAGRERGTSIEKGPRPGDASCVFSRIAPPSVKINMEANIPVRVRRSFRGHAIDCAAKLHKGQLGFCGRELTGILDKNVD